MCLLAIVSFESHEQFFSYLATATIAGDSCRAANLAVRVLLRASPTATRDLQI
jgi:hypothetical protein